MSISGADRQVADPLSDGVLDGVRDRGRNACRERLAKAFDAENVDFVPVRSSRARSMSSRLSRGSISRAYSRLLTVRCSARAIPVSWRSVMSMPSTIPLKWMIEHHIIYTISGLDHRPARPAPLPPAPGR